MTVFHLVRHAEHGLLGRVLTGRMPGVPLNERGREQALRLAQHFSGRSVAAVVSSPLQRAQETAAPIAAALGLEVATDAGLDEIDFGDWTGMTFETLQGAPGWQAWNQFRSTAPTLGGETMLEALGRALRCFARWGQAVPDGEVVVVSHQDVLKAVLAHSLGAPLDLMQRIELGAGSCSVLRVFGDGEVRMEGVNLAY
jgi:broad specificity phosphatase PhoE